VLRSVEQPIETNRANVDGTLNVLCAARDAGVRRVVLASSSSVYGPGAALPTPEDAPLRPGSPYAVTKLTGEHYARVFHQLYGLETVALRYFNVYGPRQRPDSQYAAVIPAFIDAIRHGRSPLIHGDGEQSRDFTYIADVAAANVIAATAPSEQCAGKAFNIAGGGPPRCADRTPALRSSSRRCSAFLRIDRTRRDRPRLPRHHEASRRPFQDNRMVRGMNDGLRPG
jgi:UDP-glucose 4-epimerase